MEPGPVWLGHSEQLADHTEGEWMREPFDEVDRVIGSRGGELVEQLIGDLRDAVSSAAMRDGANAADTTRVIGSGRADRR